MEPSGFRLPPMVSETDLELLRFGGKFILGIPRKPLVSCDCSSFHSESELKLLDRCLRHLSHEYLVCTPLQGYAVATFGCSLKSRLRMNASSMQRKARIRAGGVFDTRSPSGRYPGLDSFGADCQWGIAQGSLQFQWMASYTGYAQAHSNDSQKSAYAPVRGILHQNG